MLSVTFCGRTFSASELALMRQIAGEFSALGVTEMARTICELLEWKRPSGGLNMGRSLCRIVKRTRSVRGCARLSASRAAHCTKLVLKI
jgi:hypothetical protein